MMPKFLQVIAPWARSITGQLALGAIGAVDEPKPLQHVAALVAYAVISALLRGGLPAQRRELSVTDQICEDDDADARARLGAVWLGYLAPTWPRFRRRRRHSSG